MEQAPKILLVSDDSSLRLVLINYLGSHGFTATALPEGESVPDHLANGTHDAVVVADAPFGMSGLDVLRQIRSQSDLPVVMLSAESDEVERIIALELGADDCLSRSCNLRELAARLHCILRRTRQRPVTDRSPGDHVGALGLFPAERRATWRGKPVKLTSTEFNLLEILFRNSGKAIRKGELALQALGREMSQYDRSLDMHVSNLRRKLGRLADGRSPIQTVHGAGYQLIGTQEKRA